MDETLKNAKEHIDTDAFQQILDMDDDVVERDFSKNIVQEFFEQAEVTLERLETSMQSKDLAALSSLGHFLKGSSATLGLIKVKNACEAIQHLGAGLDERGHKPITDPKVSLTIIQKKLDILKDDCQQAKALLDEFYGSSLWILVNVYRCGYLVYSHM